MTGNDGSPLVEVDGVDAQVCTTRRQLLSRIGDELNFWSRTWRRRHGTPAAPVAGEDTDDENTGTDAYEEEVEEDYENWEDVKEEADDDVTA